MSTRQIQNVDVIADAGAIPGRIVITKDTDLLYLS
jgi:plastocyanin domain-containing protein